MPAYFFHLHEDGSVIADEEGTSFENKTAARDVAVRAARDLLAGAVHEGRLPLDDVIVVTDHLGQTIFSLTLGSAVGIP